MIEGIFHVAYQTDDLVAAIHFYQEIFGAELITQSVSDRGTKLAFLQVGAQEVELIEPADKAALGGRTGLIIDHVGYRVPDIHAAMAAMRSRGIAFETETPRTSPQGMQAIYLTRASAQGARIHLVQA